MEREPLHRRIAGDIERRIASGEWRPGFRIPIETELTAEYGCARMTVSRALSDLAARGLIVRRRRAGTVVAHPPVHSSALVSIPDIQAEIEGRGSAYSHRLLARAVRSARDGDSPLGGRVVALETLHLADGLPFALERRLISLDAAPEAETADFETQAPGGWLLAHTPWTEAEHRISAVAADRETAAGLGLALGAACLKLERRTWRDGQGVTWASQTFPGAAYDLVARFSPTKG
ncbi:histidine utilization repressor [Brevundimonas sp.]|uniref:histidine utilization repressor n=1 Tax=Brevundimonas sp. TaxID=1871086 RepID=UPI002FD89CD3